MITGPSRILFRVGAGFVITGGLVAAATGPLHLANGSWLAAYLVLVCGVAQCAFGAAQAHLAARPVPVSTVLAELCGWNLGSVAVIAGTMLGMPLLVDGGGVLLALTLILALRTVAGAQRGQLLWTYRGLIALLLLSIPVGLVLAHLRAG